MKKIFFSLTIIALLAACGGKQDPKERLAELRTKQAEFQVEIDSLEAQIARMDTTASRKAKTVKTEAIVAQPFTHYIDVQGIVDADENITVLPMASGEVKRLLVNEGDMVKAGQLLAEIENDIYVKQLNALQPQITAATDIFNRQKRLWEQKIGSEVQYIQAKTNKESLDKQAEMLQEQIELTRVKAPISGTVDYVGMKVGQLASPSNPMGAIRIVNMSKLKVTANVAEVNASKVKKGNAATIHFPDLKKDINSSITYAARVIDPASRTFKAEAALNGDNADYHPNMIAIIKIIDYKSDNAIVVPINLVQTTGGNPFVYVSVKEGDKFIARKKEVTLGNSYGGNVEILSGLNVGDNLVTVGAADLADGIEIKL